MSLHHVRPTTPPHQLASRLLVAEAPTVVHRPVAQRGLRGMARRREWHAFWCHLGDLWDEAADVAIAWASIVLGAVVVIGVGALVGFGLGPVAAAAYVALIAVAVALYRRWLGRRPQ